MMRYDIYDELEWDEAIDAEADEWEKVQDDIFDKIEAADRETPSPA